MTDQAPLSSSRIRQVLFRYVERGDLVDKMEIHTTVLTTTRGGFHALTTVSRPSWEKDRIGPSDLSLFDQHVATAFKSLPGFNGTYAVSMGREYSVEWDGIAKPV